MENEIMENMEKVTGHLINAIRTRGGDPARLCKYRFRNDWNHRRRIHAVGFT